MPTQGELLQSEGQTFLGEVKTPNDLLLNVDQTLEEPHTRVMLGLRGLSRSVDFNVDALDRISGTDRFFTGAWSEHVEEITCRCASGKSISQSSVQKT